MKCQNKYVIGGFAALTLTFNVQADLLTTSESEKGIASINAQETTLGYWSRDRIAAATAMVMSDTGAGGNVPGKQIKGVYLGNPATSSGGKAAADSNSIHRQAYPADWTALETDWGSLYIEGPALNAALGVKAIVQPLGTANIYTNYDVNVKTALWKLYPHRWVGKFTFTTPRGNSSCSATAISNNHILTAAHCVYDTSSRNRWYTNKAFSPAYRNGNRPYGTFATTGCTILTAWINLSGGYSINSWARHDVAVCNAGRNSARQTLNQAVGWAGRSWNYGYNQLHFNSGYPARNFADGLLSGPAQYLRSCTAESFYRATDTLGSGCYYGRGISGGSWLRNYKANYTSGNVNSVNSGLYIGQPNLYGPRFSSNNIVPICNATRC